MNREAAQVFKSFKVKIITPVAAILVLLAIMTVMVVIASDLIIGVAGVTIVAIVILLIFTRVLKPLKNLIESISREHELSQAIIESAPYVTGLWGSNNNPIYVNSRAKELFGVEDPMDVARRLYDFSPELQPCGTPTPEKAAYYAEKAYKDGYVRFEWMHNAPTGGPMPVDVIYNCFMHNDEKMLVSYTMDLREKKELEMETRRREHEVSGRVQFMLNAAPMIVQYWGRKYNLIDCNESTLRFYGVSNKEMYISMFESLIPEKQANGSASIKVWDNFLEQVFQAGTGSMEFMEIAINGQPAFFEVFALRATLSNEEVVVTYSIDITRTKEAIENERELREELEYREKLLNAGNQTAKILLTSNTIDSLMNGMEIIGHLINVDRTQIWHHGDVDGELNFLLQYEWVSERGKQKNGYPAGFVYPRNQDANWFDNTLLAGKNINCPISELPPVIEAYYARFDVVSTAIFPMILDDEIIGFFAVQDCEAVRTFTKDEMDVMASTGLMFTSVYNNIRQQEVQQLKEIAEESNRAKSRFLARMSHEIRTPITAVMGISEIQLRNQALPNHTGEAFGKIHDSAHMLLNIVNDILDFSKIESGKMPITDREYEVASLALDAAQLNMVYLEHKSIDFQMQIDERIPARLIGDMLRIRQIINNLISNAFKYTEVGSVSFSLQCVEKEGDITTLMIAIQDTGLGMSKEQLNMIASEYSRFHEQEERFVSGTGLGMSIVYNLVQMMNGQISIESEVGKGTKVLVKIPQKTCGTEVLGEELATSFQNIKAYSWQASENFKFVPEPMPYGKVLVVDDVDANLFVAKGLLAFYDLSVDTCNSGQGAIDKIKQGLVYDIVFMDYLMPEMNGNKAMLIMRDMGYHHPIVALTANAIVGQAEEFIESGFDGFVSKPIQTMQLNEVLTKFIRDKQPPEVLAKAVAKHPAETEGIDDFLNRADIAEKMRIEFAKNHKKTFLNITQSLESGDMKTAHRLAHTVKSSAGLIGEATLAQIAGSVEASLNNSISITSGQLSDLEKELFRVLEGIEVPPQRLEVASGVNAQELLCKLEPLLEARDIKCLDLLDELRKIPEAAILARQVENFDFSVAIGNLETLRHILDV